MGDAVVRAAVAAGVADDDQRPVGSAAQPSKGRGAAEQHQRTSQTIRRERRPLPGRETSVCSARSVAVGDDTAWADLMTGMAAAIGVNRPDPTGWAISAHGPKWPLREPAVRLSGGRLSRREGHDVVARTWKRDVSETAIVCSPAATSRPTSAGVICIVSAISERVQR